MPLHEVSQAASPRAIVKTAAESVTSSTVLQNDDVLLFPIGASETWIASFVLYVDGDAAGDIKVTVAGPAGATGRVSVVGPGTTATTFENATANNQVNALGTAPPAGTLGTGNVTVVLVDALIINGATPGNVTLQWAQNTSSATATRVLDASYVIPVKV